MDESSRKIVELFNLYMSVYGENGVDTKGSLRNIIKDVLFVVF